MNQQGWFCPRPILLRGSHQKRSHGGERRPCGARKSSRNRAVPSLISFWSAWTGGGGRDEMRMEMCETTFQPQSRQSRGKPHGSTTEPSSGSLSVSQPFHHSGPRFVLTWPHCEGLHKNAFGGRRRFLVRPVNAPVWGCSGPHAFSRSALGPGDREAPDARQDRVEGVEEDWPSGWGGGMPAPVLPPWPSR